MEKIKLGDVIDIRRGMTLPGEFYSETGEFIRLTAGNFDYINNCFKDNTSKSDIYYVGKIREDCLLKKGDMITPMTEQVKGLIGSTAFIPVDDLYVLSNDIGLITCSDKIDKNYCYYLISSDYVKNQLSNMAQQTKIRHTSPDKIKGVSVVLPDIDKQKKIGKILRDLDVQIERNNAMVQKLPTFRTTTYCISHKKGELQYVC